MSKGGKCMSEDKISMNMSDVESCISQINNVVESINNINNNFVAKNNRLLELWKGPAKEQFQKDYAKIAKNQQEFLKNVKTINTALKKVQKQLEEQDRKLIRR